VLLLTALLVGCSRKPSSETSSGNDPDPPFQPKRVLRDLNEKERFELLEQAMKDYHRAMESSNREGQINGLKALLPEKKDFQKAFLKDADAIYTMSEEGFYKGALDNIEAVAKEEIEYGALVKISIKDLRKKDRVSPGIKDDLANIASDTQVVEIAKHFERGLIGGICLMWVDGRWVIIPEVGGILGSLEIWRKKK
jgi:hypothetical protein